MSAISEILQSNSSTALALRNSAAKSEATAGSSSSTSTSSSSTASAAISANDFLTLLVTELKNQDPTEASDPNEYVNQMVAVNSLEQLININTTLTDDSSGTTTSTTSTSDATTAEKASAEKAAQTAGAQSDTSLSATTGLAPGNLSIPAASQSASVVASALSKQRW
jgi:flagellar basal-body rod modification protein FlgD